VSVVIRDIGPHVLYQCVGRRNFTEVCCLAVRSSTGISNKQIQVGIDMYGPLLFELDKVIVQVIFSIMIFAS